jgi:hypothetical protein
VFSAAQLMVLSLRQAGFRLEQQEICKEAKMTAR